MRSFVVLSKFVREAATGHGIDGHLLGLRHMICPETGERAASSMSRCSKEGTPAPPTLLAGVSIRTELSACCDAGVRVLSCG